MSFLLSLLLVIPFVGFIVTWVGGVNQKAAKWLALAFSLAATVLATILLASFLTPGLDCRGGPRVAELPPNANDGYVPLYFVERYPWVPQLGMNYILGVDGLSVPLLWLTPFLTTLGIVFSWTEERRPKEFFALLLLLEFSLSGVFMALDFFLFFVFWELVLIPMFFLIGIWGGPNRRYASLKFLVYTHVGSVIMLLSIFGMYWAGSAELNAAIYGSSTRTFDMTVFLHGAIRHMGPPVASYLQIGAQVPIFIAFLFGFAVKLPSVPFHTWLPDAHVEAPTAGSVLLAGVLLKMGGYGIFRVNFGMLPDASRDLWWVMGILGIVSMVYAAFVCLAQVDLKRLIAYSSIGHMGFVLLGASSLHILGVEGAIFQLFNHGLITAVLFMLAGSVKHSTGTRNIPELRGLGKALPQFSFVLIVAFFASLGLPGFNSFWSEFMVFVGSYSGPTLEPWRRLVIVPLVSIVITAAYYVYTMQRVLFGEVPEKYKDAHDLPGHERLSYAVLLGLILAVGIFPVWWLSMIDEFARQVLPWLGGV